MDIMELIDQGTYAHKVWTLNIRGCNGSGKSSLAREFVKDGFVHIYVDGLKHPAFTYSKDLNLLVLGHYKTACGGCDSLVKAQIVRLLKLAWMTTCNVLYEGVLVSDSKEPYFWYMKELNDTLKQRHWGFVYLDLSLDTCLARIQQRNGGKEIKTDLVASKHRNMLRYKQWQLDQGGCKVITLNAEQPTSAMFEELRAEIVKFQS